MPTVCAVDTGKAALGLGEAHQVADRGSFARAVGTEEAIALTPVHPDRDVEHPAAMAVVLGQLADLDHRHILTSLLHFCATPIIIRIVL